MKEWRCVVHDTEVITYQDGREFKHLKIMDSTCKEGVLQIDTQTNVNGRIVPFQLERNIPYVKIDGVWKMSETTRQDRFDEALKIQKKNMIVELSLGVVFLLAALIYTLVNGSLGEWWMAIIMGVFCCTSAGMRFVRVKQELAELKEADEEAQA